MKKFAVILAGCGVFDGAEIHEAVLTLLAIDQQGASYQCFAPDIPQAHVIDHITGNVLEEQRDVLRESARIARGDIKPLHEYKATEYDGLILPGGFGVAKNLCDWAFKGDACSVDPAVEKALKTTLEAGKAIGAMCISPVVLAKVFEGTSLTTGQDDASGAFIEKQGHHYVKTNHGEVTIDSENKIFTTPCYMLDARISDIARGTSNLVKEMLRVM